MRALDVFLLMLSYAGGRSSCKTLVQKQGYFLDEWLGLGLNYRPHFYGPYSPILDAAIGKAKALGFVIETATRYGALNRNGFEVKRFDYQLTSDGLAIVDTVKKSEPDAWTRIRECLDRLYKCGPSRVDHIRLSVAAKAWYILKSRGDHMTKHQVRETARAFGWDIPEESIEDAVNYLEEIGLATWDS